MGSWSEQYVDAQVDRAWLELRMDLAERFAAGMAAGEMEPIDFFTETGECLSIEVDAEQVIIIGEGHVVFSTNVDEAAYRVYEILHEEWQVVHPVFLDSDVVDVPAVEDNPTGAEVPTLGCADSKETLQAWVEATFQSLLDEPLRVHPDGAILWRRRRGLRPVFVNVRDQHWVEVWTVLATQVSFSKARRAIEKLSRRWPACWRCWRTRLRSTSCWTPRSSSARSRCNLTASSRC